MINDELYTIEQASQEFHIPPWRLYEARDKGRLIPADRSTRRQYLFTRETLVAYQQSLSTVQLPKTEREVPMIQTTPIKPEPMPMRIGSLYRDRERFLYSPPYQRELVWPLDYKQELIDSILREWPINSLTLMEDTNEQGERIYQVTEGQQRLGTIFQYLEGGFATMTQAEADGYLMTIAPLEPGRRFDELSSSAKNRILDYRMPFTSFPKAAEGMMEEIFLRFQNQTPLTQGERLFVRTSRARSLALELIAHPFWKQYKVGNHRREHYVAALMLLTIETFSFPVHLKLNKKQRTALAKVVLGEVDSELTNTLNNGILNRLSRLCHVFTAPVYNNGNVILMYEAAHILEDEGFDLGASEEGCLNEWFWGARRSLLRERLGVNLPETRMTLINTQRQFWEMHRATIQQVEGLVKKG